MHEFDQKYSPPDACFTVTSKGEGTLLGKGILRLLTQTGHRLPKPRRLLGLGAGMAVPELELAQVLQVPEECITLIDKNADQPEIRARFSALHPTVRYLNTGIFTYLTTSSPRVSHALVTAFGLEYLWTDPKKLTVFVTGLPQVTAPGGLVCVYPNDGVNIDPLWQAHGFRIFHRNRLDHGVSIYIRNRS